MKTVKVCFMLDCTSSMKECIHKSKNKIFEILEDINNEYIGYDVYASFIGYRDYRETFHRADFTKDHQYIYHRMSYISPLGGEDQAEDVAGAYAWVNALDWSADKKFVFHITDAPEHGMKYHDDSVTDNFPNGNPIIDLLEEVGYLANNHINLTVFRINKSTNMMYSLMRQVYKKVDDVEFNVIDFMDLRPVGNSF